MTDKAMPMTGRSTGRYFATEQDDVQRIERVEEVLRIAKRRILTGRVKVRTETESVDQLVSETLEGNEVTVTRVPVGQWIEPGFEVPRLRTEGDVTIVPVMEEVLFVEKRLMLKEELHIRRETTAETTEVPVTLRRQKAVIDRTPANPSNPEIKG